MYMPHLRANAALLRDYGRASLVLQPLCVQRMDKPGVLPQPAIGGRVKRGYNRLNDKPYERVQR